MTWNAKLLINGSSDFDMERQIDTQVVLDFDMESQIATQDCSDCDMERQIATLGHNDDLTSNVKRPYTRYPI